MQSSLLLLCRTIKLSGTAWTPRAYGYTLKRTITRKLGRVRCSDWFGILWHSTSQPLKKLPNATSLCDSFFFDNLTRHPNTPTILFFALSEASTFLFWASQRCRTTKLSGTAWTSQAYGYTLRRTRTKKLGRVRCSDWFGVCTLPTTRPSIRRGRTSTRHLCPSTCDSAPRLGPIACPTLGPRWPSVAHGRTRRPRPRCGRR